MAASTWFQGSEWPPWNQGIIPSASWTSAMASTVVATSGASRMPGTSGSCTSRLPDERRRGGRLGGVHDEALADQGIEGPLDEAHGAGGLGDVPRQEAVVEPGEKGLVVVDTHRALQPPVRRVQGVGVVGARELEAGRA